MENKPTPTKGLDGEKFKILFAILKYRIAEIDESLMPLIHRAMQEYAEEYHKEKLKEDLIKFTIFISEMDYKDAAAERVINEYLEIIE